MNLHPKTRMCVQGVPSRRPVLWGKVPGHNLYLGLFCLGILHECPAISRLFAGASRTRPRTARRGRVGTCCMPLALAIAATDLCRSSKHDSNREIRGIAGRYDPMHTRMNTKSNRGFIPEGSRNQQAHPLTTRNRGAADCTPTLERRRHCPSQGALPRRLSRHLGARCVGCGI